MVYALSLLWVDGLAEIRRIGDQIWLEGFHKMTKTVLEKLEITFQDKFLKCSYLIDLFPDMLQLFG